MSDREAARERIARMARVVVLARLVALNVTIIEVVSEPDRATLTSLALACVALGLYYELRLWTRGEELARSPWLLVADFTVSMGLFAYLGVESPFFLSTLGIALLGGAVHGRRGAVLAGIGLLAAYYGTLIARGSTSLEFPTVVTLPLIYPAAAAGAAAVRALLEGQASTLEALRSAQLAAVAGDERSRVAREMHDSLGKTLYGIALQASGLARRIEGEAPEAAAAARRLSGGAQLAASEARELINDLRSDALHLPLGTALAAHVERWSEESGVAAHVDGGSVDLPNPGTRYELFSIVKEALRNVERHAQASSVHIALREEGEEVVLVVADDGIGMEASGSVAEIEPEGHWGLIGMVERGERVGAEVRVTGAPGEGTRVEARIPRGDVRTPEPWQVASGTQGALS